MATLLQSHLDQIALCATSIATLPFPGPKIFTNALLSNSHDITSLIRDTEQHERALFHLAPPPLPKSGSSSFGESISAPLPAPSGAAGKGRRQTTYGARQPRNKAVAAVLGGDLYQQTREGEGERRGLGTGARGELNVEVLLTGAEKLAAVYPIPGATDRIVTLRRRHQQLAANISHYETRVAEQTRELQALNRPTSRSGFSDPDADGEDAQAAGGDEAEAAIPLTREDLEREEQEVRELEAKKKALEERVEGMGRDLGGLMR